MQFATKRIDTFIHAMMGDLTPTGKAWARVGVIVLIVAAAMSFDFGRSVSIKHGLFLAGLTFVAAFGPEAAYRAFELKKYFIGGLATLGALGMLTIQLGVDQSYTAGIRGSNRDEARVQNTKYDDGRANTTDYAAKKKLLEDTRERLNAEMAKLVQVKVNGSWTVTATPSSSAELDGPIAAKQLEVDVEAKRGNKCATKCAERTNELGHLKQLKGLAEKIEKNETEYQATLIALTNVREASAKTEYKSSSVVHANQAIAKAIAFVSTGELKPSAEIEEGTDIGTNTAMAIAATLVPAFCFLMAVALYGAKGGNIPSPSQVAGALVGKPEPGSLAGSIINNVKFDDIFGKMSTAMHAERVGKAANAA